MKAIAIAIAVFAASFVIADSVMADCTEVNDNVDKLHRVTSAIHIPVITSGQWTEAQYQDVSFILKSTEYALRRVKRMNNKLVADMNRHDCPYNEKLDDIADMGEQLHWDLLDAKGLVAEKVLLDTVSFGNPELDRAIAATLSRIQ